MLKVSLPYDPTTPLLSNYPKKSMSTHPISSNIL
jgi:hypothetical protein